MSFFKDNFLSDFWKPELLLKKPFNIFCTMFGFWIFFDTTITFLVPLKMNALGFSPWLIGLMFAISATTGALFDLVSLKIFKTASYKKLFSTMFILCLVYPMILFFSNNIPLLILTMGIWGIYFSLHSMGNMDYIGRRTDKKSFAINFGKMQIIQAISALLAPALISILIITDINITPFLIANCAVLISYVFFKKLINKQRRSSYDETFEIDRTELVNGESGEKIILKIAKILSPLLMLHTLHTITKAFFVTIGSLLAMAIFKDKLMIGSVVIAYIIPQLFVGLFIDKIAAKGKKRMAIISTILGSIALITLFFISNPYLILLIIFIASVFVAIAGPTIRGSFADYVHESPPFRREVETLSNLSMDIGFIIGPITAGLLAQVFGLKMAFVAAGIIGCIIGGIIMKLMPRKINITKQMQE